MKGLDLLEPDSGMYAALTLVRDTRAKVGQISPEMCSYGVLDELQSQLDLLDSVFQSMHKHKREASKGHIDTQAFDSAYCQLSDLRSLVEKAEAHRGPRFLKKARLKFSGFEEQAKEWCPRLEKLRTSLQLSLEASTIQDRNWAQLRHALQPSTNDFIPKKLAGTGEWIWSHETFKYWVKKPTVNPGLSSSTNLADKPDIDTRVLLIHGVEGCGKSVLAASVHSDLRKRHKMSLFFSFPEGQKERRADAMLRDFLWQLLHYLPQQQQREFIVHLLQNQARLVDADYLLFEMQKLDIMHQYDIYFILDGIDESTDDWNGTSSSPVGILIQLLKSNRKMHLLLFGRQTALGMALQKWSLQIEVSRNLVWDDMSKLIKFELDDCPDITDGAVCYTVRKELELIPGLTFLRIKHAFEQLRLASSPEEVRLTLSRLYDGLN